MFIHGERIPQQCPVVGGLEETGWNIQCPMYNQWSRQPDSYVCNVQNQRYNSGLSVQCHRDYYPHEYTHPQQYYVPPVVYPQPTQLQTNLPCYGRLEWDYNSMCYNVDGQACQYTAVVDLEDFMNNEKRKEKSRVAARCRRTKEMQIFAELTAALPAKKEEVEQLDKASVMRLAISYLKVRDVVSMLPEDSEPPKLQSPKGLEEIQSELSYMKALDGFVFVLSQQGDIVYCSENISEHLGVSQMEIMGQSVFEFSHLCDHDEIRDALRSNDVGRRELLLRLKCTLTSKGRNVHLKSASYKVIHLTGHMLIPSDSKDSSNQEQNNADGDEERKDTEAIKKFSKVGSLVAVGRPIPHPSNIEIPLDSKTFLSKHSLDMKFTYTDEGLMNTLGFEPDELVGRTLYDYHHAADSSALIQHFKSLFSKGQCETGQYRFLSKSGGYAWVQTQATVITDKQQKPVSVVCVNYVISGIECKDEVFAAHQMQHADLKPTVAPKAQVPLLVPRPISVNTEPSNGDIVATVFPEEERPIPVTEFIFAPREKEMNKGFLMFSQDEGLTMLKDEPEDLTHLAPTAGDTCIPLENSPFDMFDDLLNDNYCSLLGDDLASASPVDSLIGESFMSSPERQETESSCEQSSLLAELSLDAFDSARSENDVDDGNSPFIPTTDELPLLEPAVMWGALPDNVSQARPQPTEIQTSAPALKRLLAAPPTGPPPQDLITNIYSDQGLIPSRSIPSWDTGVKRILKQEEEPSAKRSRRSPSPAPKTPSTNSSSVLMNLLDIPQQKVPVANQKGRRNYQILLDPQKIRNLPIPVINIIQSTATNQPISDGKNVNTNIRPSVMTPLTLSVGSPIYSLPSSPNTPNYSPAVSPHQKDCLKSPYATPQSLSPASSYQSYSPGHCGKLVPPNGVIQGYDPYLTNKMQTSPSFPLQSPEMLIDSTMPLNSQDYWTEPDILQGTSEMLTALIDDVKL